MRLVARNKSNNSSADVRIQVILMTNHIRELFGGANLRLDAEKLLALGEASGKVW